MVGLVPLIVQPSVARLPAVLHLFLEENFFKSALLPLVIACLISSLLTKLNMMLCNLVILSPESQCSMALGVEGGSLSNFLMNLS